ncbi:MAG: ribbon-helix-helix domain-containing protein [Pseudomonadota bacterium]
MTLKGHRTSIALEKAFWDVLEELAQSRKQSLAHLITEADMHRTHNLASTLRLMALEASRTKEV